MRYTWRTLLLIVAMVVGTMQSGQAAVAQRSQDLISIIGNKTAFVDVTFDERFTLDKESTTFESDGSFVGWMMYRLGEPFSVSKGNVAGAYVIRDVVPPDEALDSFHFNIGFRSKNLAPGTYRIYLLADAPANIHIPIVKGAATTRLRPRFRAKASATTAELAVIAGAVNDTKHTPVRVTDNTLTISTLFFSASQGATVQNVQACVKKEMEPVAGCEGGGIAGYVIHPLVGYTFSLSTFYEPRILDPGDYYAFQRATAGVVVQRAVGASLSVELKGV